MAYHQGRGQAHQTASGIRKGEGSDRGLSHTQGADRVHRKAAAIQQDRAPRQIGRAEEGLTNIVHFFLATAPDLRHSSPGMTSEIKALSTPTSPLAPAQFPDMPPVEGVKFATAAAGIRYAGRTDVLLALFKEGTTFAGAFTRSKCPSAPVDWCRAHLKGGSAAPLVVNS